MRNFKGKVKTGGMPTELRIHKIFPRLHCFGAIRNHDPPIDMLVLLLAAGCALVEQLYPPTLTDFII
jgi:hypothetical protein